MRGILIGILPVLGVVLGALLQHKLAKSKEREAQFASIRQQTYADYVGAVSAVAAARSPDSIAQLIDAKSRMAIYASNEVIDRLSEFETVGPNLTSPVAKEAFVKLAGQMRAESGATATRDASLSTVFFGVVAPNVRSDN